MIKRRTYGSIWQSVLPTYVCLTNHRLVSSFRKNIHTHTHTHTYIYIYIYIYIYHHHVALVAQISLNLSRHSSLSFIAQCRSSGQHPVSSSCFCTAMCRGPWEYISYEFVPASPAVSCMSGSSNLNSFLDRRQVAVQLVSCGVLSPGLVQDCSQH